MGHTSTIHTKIKKPLIVGICILFVFLIFTTLKVYGLVTGPDTQCSSRHTTAASSPSLPKKAEEFFALANYKYDIGKCQEAITAYTNAIDANPSYAEAYNNRGYTYMRLRNYDAALIDLTKAISLKNTYAEPYMNRGDIYNFYGPIDRQKAIADYKKAIALGAVHNTSVCGHLAMAETNNLIPLALLKFVFNRGYCK